ncbi:MAG: HAMP domain-containing histidine kinase [Bacteriovoracaceae bacterium]|nr:HAMP domain-containing histidine kinase [Bacteriovoracaceae bacterium]
METVTKFIFLFLIGTTVLNFIIAIAARIKTGMKEFNELTLYWVALFATYLAVAALSKNPTEIALSYYVQFIPTFMLAKMLMDSRGLRFNINFFATVQFIGSLVTTYLLFYTDVGFTLSLMPITFSTVLPLWSPIWNIFVSNSREANWIEKGMAIMFITGVINHFNFAFFRLNPSTAWWGWSVSIAQYQCLSIFLPLLINFRREVKERQNLELALEKISGQNVHNDVEIDDLYRNLEIQIIQKEELTTKLQKTNLKLEDEREMNEILIKTVSHDLANPLTVINAYIDMLQMGRIPEEDRSMILGRIKNNTRMALDMISRIRNAIVTRNQANIVAIHDVSIDRSIRNLLTQFESHLKEKNIHITYESSIPLDIFVAAEENTLTEHVFANILSNAIKFSYDNSEIKIKVTEVQNMVQVEIRDFGVGINQERMSKRLLHSTEGTNGETGTGFGMMVMGYFLRHFGATHSIHSEGSDKGTTVTISLKKSNAKFPNYTPERPVANIYS